MSEELEPEEIIGQIESEGYCAQNPIDPARFEEYAAALVASESRRDELGKFMGAVNKLREGGKSYRAIARLLTDLGVEVSHTELWRAYREWSEMSPEDMMEAEREADLAAQEAEEEARES